MRSTCGARHLTASCYFRLSLASCDLVQSCEDLKHFVRAGLSVSMGAVHRAVRPTFFVAVGFMEKNSKDANTTAHPLQAETHKRTQNEYSAGLVHLPMMAQR